MQESATNGQSEGQAQHTAMLATPEVELTDREQAFVTAYTSGKTRFNATQSYMVAFPNASYQTAHADSSPFLATPSIQVELARLAASRQISADFVLDGLYEEASRTKTVKRKRVYDESGTQVSETIEEVDHDRVPALSLAAELTGQKRNVTAAALTVSVHIGGIDD